MMFLIRWDESFSWANLSIGVKLLVLTFLSSSGDGIESLNDFSTQVRKHEQNVSLLILGHQHRSKRAL